MKKEFNFQSDDGQSDQPSAADGISLEKWISEGEEDVDEFDKEDGDSNKDNSDNSDEELPTPAAVLSQANEGYNTCPHCTAATACNQPGHYHNLNNRA